MKIQIDTNRLIILKSAQRIFDADINSLKRGTNHILIDAGSAGCTLYGHCRLLISYATGYVSLMRDSTSYPQEIIHPISKVTIEIPVSFRYTTLTLQDIIDTAQKNAVTIVHDGLNFTDNAPTCKQRVDIPISNMVSHIPDLDECLGFSLLLHMNFKHGISGIEYLYMYY